MQHSNNGGKMDQEQRWLTVEEVAKYLRVSRATIYRMVKNDVDGMGIIPHYKIGKKYLFIKNELLLWLKRGGCPNVDKDSSSDSESFSPASNTPKEN